MAGDISLMRTLALTAIAVLLGQSLAGAQGLPAQARLPLQHWTVPFLEHFARAGKITDPTPLERPWQVGQIAAALARADTQRMTSAERRTRRQILETLEQRSAEQGFVVGGDAGLVVSTHQRRPQFSLRHTGTDRVTPEMSGLFGFWFGPALLIVHPRYNEDLYDDPEYAGAPDQAEIRTEEAYGAFDSRYLAVELGKISRNWGPPGFPGLLVSDWPLSYDHLFVRLGPRRVHMNMLVTQLDDAPDGRGQLVRRFFVAHRLEARLVPWLDLAAWQGTVVAGPNRNLEIWYLNPIQPAYFGAIQYGQLEENFMFGGDGQMRWGRFILSGSAFFDDWDLTTGEPPALAFTATAATSLGAASAWLGYTMVGNLAYRTDDPAEKPLMALDPGRGRFGTGLARNFADYDQVTARLSVVPVPGLILTPEVTLLRQGEGDPRLPYPTQAEFPQTPVIFEGVVERTWRAALVSTVQLPFGLEAHLDAGIHRVQNAGHQTGVSRTDFVGTAVLRYGLWHSGPFD
jgi:hypothetical protein